MNVSQGQHLLPHRQNTAQFGRREEQELEAQSLHFSSRSVEKKSCDSCHSDREGCSLQGHLASENSASRRRRVEDEINPTECKQAEGVQLFTVLERQKSVLEYTVKRMEEEAAMKDEEILSLRNEWGYLQVDLNGASVEAWGQNAYLLEENQHLKQELSDMKAFLADYGLVWVGPEATSTRKEQPSLGGGRAIDFDRLFRRIQELNGIISSEGQSHVVRTPGGHGAMFRGAGIINLTIYKDGIKVEGGNVRSYSDPKTRRFVVDILDGYFPSELKEDFPEGFLIRALDLRNIHSSDTSGALTTAFVGEGRRLGGQESKGGKYSKDQTHSSMYPRLTKVRSCQDLLLKEQQVREERGGFEKECPKTKKTPDEGGQEYETRGTQLALHSPVIDTASSPGDEETPIIPPAARRPVQVSLPLIVKASYSHSSPQSADDILGSSSLVYCCKRGGREDVPRDSNINAKTELRIRLHGFKETIVVRMGYKDTVGDLQKLVLQHLSGSQFSALSHMAFPQGKERCSAPSILYNRGEEASNDFLPSFEIRSTFPSQVHGNLSQTLEDAGLVPNAVVIFASTHRRRAVGR